MRIEEFIMTILRDLDMNISQAAVIIMLETGICTEECKFDQYVIPKNIIEAFSFPEEEQPDILTRTVNFETRPRLLQAWENHREQRLSVTGTEYYQECINAWLYRA